MRSSHFGDVAPGRHCPYTIEAVLSQTDSESRLHALEFAAQQTHGGRGSTRLAGADPACALQ
jgi:hypothetical protein